MMTFLSLFNSHPEIADVKRAELKLELVLFWTTISLSPLHSVEKLFNHSIMYHSQTVDREQRRKM